MCSVSRPTTSVPVPSCLTASSCKERVSISWEQVEEKRPGPWAAPDNGLPHSFMIWVWIWFVHLGTLQTVEHLVHPFVEQLRNPTLSSGHVSKRSLEKADANTSSILTSPISRSVSSGFPDRSQIGLGLDWVGLESLTH